MSLLHFYYIARASSCLRKCKSLLNEKQAYLAAEHFYKALYFNERLPEMHRIIERDEDFLSIRKSLDVLLTRKGF